MIVTIIVSALIAILMARLGYRRGFRSGVTRGSILSCSAIVYETDGVYYIIEALKRFKAANIDQNRAVDQIIARVEGKQG